MKGSKAFPGGSLSAEGAGPHRKSKEGVSQNSTEKVLDTAFLDVLAPTSAKK